MSLLFNTLLTGILLTTNPIVNGGSIDPVLGRYYNEYKFFVDTSCNPDQYIHPLEFVIRFGDLSSRKDIGLTTTYTIFGKTIYTVVTIDSAYWSTADKAHKLALTYHEYTHALFDYPDLKDNAYIHHYMYYKDNMVSEEDVKKQLLEILTDRCKSP